jgi:cystathionine beta-lyase/cystathionine gamma-synthase
MKSTGPSTRVIHAGESATHHAAAVTTPIYETTTFLFASAEEVRQCQEGKSQKFIYSRYANPTVVALEETLAAIDGAQRALAFGSGMGAISTTLLALLKAGDEIVCASAVYGGTWHFLNEVLPGLHIKVRFAGLDELRRPGEAISEQTRILWFETPTNPTLRCLDIRSIAAACRSRGVWSVLDNTFATPVNQQPLALGVDIAVQSATKYLNGHSDVTAGVVTGARERLEPIERMRRMVGTILDPQPAYALGRGLKTLPVRVQAHNANAMVVASFLEGCPHVTRVFYPGLDSHPDREVARTQMCGFGGMVTFELEGGLAAACRVYDSLQVIRRAASLGGVESLASLPVLTSHWGYSDEDLERAAVTPAMVRLSIGLEDPEDLIADLRQAIVP